MTTPAYPANLPLPTVSGYTLAPESNVVRSDFESGPARSRRRYRSVPTRLNIQFIYTRDEFAVFEYWYAAEIFSGTSWFTMMLANGVGITTMECRLIGTYRAQALSGLNFQVTCEIEVRSTPILDQESYDALNQSITFTSEENVLNQIINTELPQDI